MTSLAVPPASADPVQHADWLELEALRAADRNSSLQDLASVLRRGGTPEEIEDEDFSEDGGGETTEPIVEDAFAEIEDRAKSCDGRYPFTVAEDHLQGTRGTPNALYTFLLLLSRFGSDAAPDGFNVTQLFEEVAAVAIGNTLGGERNQVGTYQFGFPRRIGPPGFRDALDELCRRTGEGGQSKDRPTRRDQKDAALDLVAWRRFPDERRSIVMAWGQCATGDNWGDKLTELQPADWSENWLMERPSLVPFRAFFVPHRVERKRWEVTANSSGLLFDRCRLSALAAPLPIELRQRCAEFNRHVLRERVRV